MRGNMNAQMGCTHGHRVNPTPSPQAPRNIKGFTQTRERLGLTRANVHNQSDTKNAPWIKGALCA